MNMWNNKGFDQQHNSFYQQGDYPHSGKDDYTSLNTSIPFGQNGQQFFPPNSTESPAYRDADEESYSTNGSGTYNNTSFHHNQQNCSNGPVRHFTSYLSSCCHRKRAYLLDTTRLKILRILTSRFLSCSYPQQIFHNIYQSEANNQILHGRSNLFHNNLYPRLLKEYLYLHQKLG